MSKITPTKLFRKFRTEIETAKHYEFAEYNGVRFPVLMSSGQIVNIKKAYERWIKTKSDGSN